MWRSETEDRRSPIYGHLCDFPDVWTHVCGVTFGTDSPREPPLTVWNAANPLVRAVDGDSWGWATEVFAESLDPLPQVGDLTQSAARAAAWILMAVHDRANGLWDGLRDRDHAFLPQLWQLCFGEGDDALVERSICHRTEAWPDTRTRVLTPTAWAVLREHDHAEEVARVLPPPPQEWWLTTADGSRTPGLNT